MKKIITLTLFLGIVSAIAGGLLSYVNNLTAPVIKDLAIAAEKDNLVKIFPNGDFSEVEFEDESGLIKGAYEAKGEGYVYKAEVVGYNASSPIAFLVGFDLDGNIKGFEITSIQETKGIGDRVTTDEFTSTFVGKSANESISVLSGATYSSTAVIKGINAAKAIFAEQTGMSINTDAPTTPEVSAPTLADDYAENAATIISAENGVYEISVKGFGLLQGDASHGYTENIFVVTIADGKVASVECKQFGDTKGLGDKAVADDYLATFAGKGLEDEVEVVSGATYTSKAVIAAVQKALEDANGIVAATIQNSDFSKNEATVTATNGNVYTVEVKGFGLLQGDASHGYSANVFDITVENNAVSKVVVSNFGDTKGLGDKAFSDEELAKVNGMTLESEFDVMSGATYSSNSLYAAIQAALNAANQ